MLCQGKDIAACNLFEVRSKAPAKRVPGGHRIDPGKRRQQSAHLSGGPRLLCANGHAGLRLVTVGIRRAWPAVTELAVSRPGEHAKRAEAPCTMAANAIERSGVDCAM
jgi:hypothetical protein